jgi:predicted enzyme related to lactoylglutathione lyase
MTVAAPSRTLMCGSGRDEEGAMFRVTGVKYILMVEDMNRAVEFYSKTFGLSIGYQSPDWSELTWDDAVVALHSGGSGQRVDTGLSFQVDDIDAAVAAVTAAGGTVVRKPHAPEGEGILLADLVDPEGNGFMLSQPAP